MGRGRISGAAQGGGRCHGAALAAACVKAIGMLALAIPLASVGAVLAMDFHRPFARQP